jgi:Beta-galactosidase
MVDAPTAALYRSGNEEKICKLMAVGRTLVMTYPSGVEDASDLSFLGGTPQGMMDVFSLGSTELDASYNLDASAGVGEGNTYEIGNFCSVVKRNGAQAGLPYRGDL